MKAKRISALLVCLVTLGVTSAFGLKWHSAASPAPGHYCNAYQGLPASSGIHSGMVFVQGGKFTMGSDRHFSEEKPARTVVVSSFWIDTHEVTNAQFDLFVKATGYVTVAERPVDASKYPGAQPDLLKPGGLVFHQPETLKDVTDYTKWWRYTPGAYWRQPEGPGSSITERMNHPVVQITHEDAKAYAQWAKRDIPTEAEWEYAARGGIAEAEYVWGSEKTPSGKWQANVWQGRFPVSNMLLDGYQGTSPVGCFSANGYGLFDMAGNVWEITSDDYRDLRGIQRDMKVVKGGSHLCADNYCFRYRPAARQPATTDVGTSHIGFRTVSRQNTADNGK
jgi:formylglycine-generating enzyme required for sulfatase activity